MIVYHGTTMEIKEPNVSFSKNYLDFGKGFYVTTYKEQAERWALRKALRLNKEAVVNIYELNENNNAKILNFETENEAWIDFVCDCRRGGKEYENYDIIKGGVADDNVFKAIDMYEKGIWDKKRTLEELKCYKTNDQICIVNQKNIETQLVFLESYKVGDKND